MGNPMWSYKDMCLEADRLIRDADEIDKKSDFKAVEERLRKYNHNKNFYYNCGAAVSNVINEIFETEGNNSINAAVGGLSQFENFIELDDNEPDVSSQKDIQMKIRSTIKELESLAIEFETFGICSDYVELTHAISIVRNIGKEK